MNYSFGVAISFLTLCGGCYAMEQSTSEQDGYEQQFEILAAEQASVSKKVRMLFKPRGDSIPSANLGAVITQSLELQERLIEIMAAQEFLLHQKRCQLRAQQLKALQKAE